MKTSVSVLKNYGGCFIFLCKCFDAYPNFSIFYFQTALSRPQDKDLPLKNATYTHAYALHRLVYYIIVMT